MKRVYTARHPPDAHLLADLLEVQGIPAATQNMNYGRDRLTLNPPSPSVWIVEDSDLERAMKFIEEYSRRASPEPAETWQCPTCGEHIEEQFSTCWQCSAPTLDPDEATSSKALDSYGSESISDSVTSMRECPECGAPERNHRSWCPKAEKMKTRTRTFALAKTALGLIMLLLGIGAFAIGGLTYGLAFGETPSVWETPTLMISGVIVGIVGVALAIGVGEK